MRSRRRRFVPMAGPYVDEHTRPMSRVETILAVVFLIEVLAVLVMAALFLPDQFGPTDVPLAPIVEPAP